MMTIVATSTLARGISCPSTSATVALRRGSNTLCHTWQPAEAEGGPAIIAASVDRLCCRYI